MTKLVQNDQWVSGYKIYGDFELKDHAGSRGLNVVYYVVWLPNLARIIPAKFIMMMTFMQLKGHQRSNVVNYVLWLPDLIRRIPGES